MALHAASTSTMSKPSRRASTAEYWTQKSVASPTRKCAASRGPGNSLRDRLACADRSRKTRNSCRSGRKPCGLSARPVYDEIGVKRRSGRALDAMIGPQRLLAICHRDRVEGVRAGMHVAKELWPEGCQSWVSTTWSKRPARRLITTTTASPSGNRQRAAGAEIVLHVDYQQQIIFAWSDLHSGPLFVFSIAEAESLSD